MRLHYVIFTRVFYRSSRCTGPNRKKIGNPTNRMIYGVVALRSTEHGNGTERIAVTRANSHTHIHTQQHSTRETYGWLRAVFLCSCYYLLGCAMSCGVRRWVCTSCCWSAVVHCPCNQQTGFCRRKSKTNIYPDRSSVPWPLYLKCMDTAHAMNVWVWQQVKWYISDTHFSRQTVPVSQSLNLILRWFSCFFL